MRHLFSFLAVLAMLAACTNDPQTSESAPQADESAATGVHHEDDRTRAILFRLKGPEEERPTNRR